MSHNSFYFRDFNLQSILGGTVTKPTSFPPLRVSWIPKLYPMWHFSAKVKPSYHLLIEYCGWHDCISQENPSKLTDWCWQHAALTSPNYSPTPHSMVSWLSSWRELTTRTSRSCSSSCTKEWPTCTRTGLRASSELLRCCRSVDLLDVSPRHQIRRHFEWEV